MTTQPPEALPALIERLRLLPIDHAPDGWPAVRTREITALLDRITELEAQLDAIGAGGVEPLRKGAAPAAVAGPSQETCQTCQGNGEVVTDWERYKHPLPGDVGDEAVAECQDCDGQGTVDAAPTAQAATAAVAGPLNELEELSMLKALIDIGARAAHAHAKSNSDDGHTGTAAYTQWHELRAEMGKLIRQAYAAHPVAPVSQRDALAAATTTKAAPVAQGDAVAALQPFAEIGAWLFARDLPDDTPVVEVRGINGTGWILTRGHFKAAALAARSQAKEGGAA